MLTKDDVESRGVGAPAYGFPSSYQHNVRNDNIVGKNTDGAHYLPRKHGEEKSDRHGGRYTSAQDEAGSTAAASRMQRRTSSDAGGNMPFVATPGGRGATRRGDYGYRLQHAYAPPAQAGRSAYYSSDVTRQVRAPVKDLRTTVSFSTGTLLCNEVYDDEYTVVFLPYCTPYSRGL